MCDVFGKPHSPLPTKGSDSDIYDLFVAWAKLRHRKLQPTWNKKHKTVHLPSTRSLQRKSSTGLQNSAMAWIRMRCRIFERREALTTAPSSPLLNARPRFP